MLWVGLQCVIWVFPDHTHFLLLREYNLRTLASGLFPVKVDNHDLQCFCMSLGGVDHAYSAMNLYDEWQKLKKWLVKQFAYRYKFITVYLHFQSRHLMNF